MESNKFECSPETVEFLCNRLLDQSQPIGALQGSFSLRNLSGDRPREALSRAMRDPSNLLAHEAAFAVGQMQDADAIPALEEVLKDKSLHPIVRHEAAEALGAIATTGVIALLESVWMEDSTVEVLETCELALRRIVDQKIVHKGYQASLKDLRFQSVDPALPASFDGSLDQLSEVLLNEEEEIYERYAALFALRNIGHDASVGVIIKALGAESALLRHEGPKEGSHLSIFNVSPSPSIYKHLWNNDDEDKKVAYVLGQLQNKENFFSIS
ncbi:hypothetical protein HPP92_007825 [Vanilla planifolia]|uniref:Deoxyhypusine hydroxylase n=1 Tax=Vanilla planifolia TaxID=51239 RepID=A0A835RHD5_VANPL|nr:hypothetical protein HPP92_007825 [Vanilla planifolia]